MFKNYRSLWWLLTTALAIFVCASVFGPVNIMGLELKRPKFVEAVRPKPRKTVKTAASKPAAVAAVVKQAPLDTASKTILFIGDSMLEGLSPRLAAYAKQNGHTLYSVMWYSSTSEIWGGSGKLASYIKRLHPDYIFICLGANELFVKDIAEKRDKYVKRLVAEAGNIPLVWIGPPNWKPDTGINDLIAANVPAGSFFLSNGMHFERSKDGAHPTHASAALWMDSVARWMPRHAAHPIRMEKPAMQSARPKRIFVHQPNER